jgi:type I restriction enzyme S subunit
LALLELNQYAIGQAQPGLSVGVLEKVSIASPSTSAEQQKIADCLTSLDECVAAQGRKVEALKAHKKGLMQQLFPREGETLPRLRFPEFDDAWNETELGKECQAISSGNDKVDPEASSIFTVRLD